MEQLLNLKDISGRTASADRSKFVVLINDGKDALGDPSTQGIWWSYSKYEAKRMCKVLEKDFKAVGHPFRLEEAIRILALRRYGLELKPPYTVPNLRQQLIESVIMKGASNVKSN